MNGIERIEQRWAKATPGPWTVEWEKTGYKDGHFEDPYPLPEDEWWVKGIDGPGIATEGYYGPNPDDARAIAAAPEDIRLLLAVAKAAKDYRALIHDLGRAAFKVTPAQLDEASRALDVAVAGLDGARDEG